MSVASRTPAEKDIRKMVMEIPTTAPALRPAVAGSWPVKMSGSGLVGCGSVLVFRYTYNIKRKFIRDQPCFSCRISVVRKSIIRKPAV